MIPPRHHSFPALADPETRILILGSLPGAQSLAAKQYYAHPQNQFWNLLEYVFAIPLMSSDYADRLRSLQQHHIGLWDVIQSANRPGSSDSDIKDAAFQNLESVLHPCPDLLAIAFNGGKASQIGRRILAAKGSHYTLFDSAGRKRDIRLLDLPSSSAANTQAFAAKAEAWAVLAPFARPA